MTRIIIAIDGYSSTGKGTFAVEIARRLGILYLDSGALYRTVTLYALKHGQIEWNGEILYRQLQELRERLQRREKELMEERQKTEVERQQHAAAQQALMARLSALEMGLPGATLQSREARSVRLAPWMGLKK